MPRARTRPTAPPHADSPGPLLVLRDAVVAIVAAADWEGRDPTLRQIAALLLIYSREAPYTINTLAERLCIPAYAMTRVCNWLELRGAIRRQIQPDDRRSIVLLRTTHGMLLCAAIARHCRQPGIAV